MLLEVNNLSVMLNSSKAAQPLVNSVSFKLAQNQCLGILGESGSGKSITTRAINGLLGDSFITTGQVSFNGVDLLALNDKQRAQLRGRQITMIMQSPMTAFDPLFTIGNHVAETLRRHLSDSKKQSLQRMASAFEKVNLRDPYTLFNKYPHELSGGMLQRIMIAFAVVLKPDLIIADEPTTAIDYISQQEVIHELQKIRERYNTAIIFISHDLSLISHICDKVLVMKQGEVVEQGSTQQVFASPQDPHTRYLIHNRMKLIKRFQQVIRPADAH